MAKVILISQFPLPYSKIGSWTNMYKNYLENNHNIDYIICPKPNILFSDVKYGIVEESLSSKIKKKITRNNHISYLDALSKIINPSEKYIVQIVDNFGIVKYLSDFLNKNNIRGNIYLQFFYHGFSPFYGNFESRWFYENIDEMVLLTHDSYLSHLNTYTQLPVVFSVLNNGIDTSRFHKVSKENKLNFRNELGIRAKNVFIWCSKDRSKKGLDFILNVWKSLGTSIEDCELLVVGATRTTDIKGVRFLGQIPNDELPKYYQTADVYLFPTLCQEGFGMSLIEALNCGCYCIASSLGGVPEVLGYGKYGKLIEDPHFPDQWKSAILDYLDGDYNYEKLPKDKYSTKEWNTNMNRLIIDAKKSMS